MNGILIWLKVWKSTALKKKVTGKMEYIFHNADIFMKNIGTTFRI